MVERRCQVCGALVSRYNKEARCASCQRGHDRGRSAAAALLPEEVRDDPLLRVALESGRWSEVLRTVMAAGVRQGMIAQVSGVSQSAISRLATGRSRAPGIATVRALCDALGVPRSWAGLADPQEDPTDRRQLLALAAAGRDGADGCLRAAALRVRGDAAQPVWPWLMQFDDAKLARYRARVADARGDHSAAARLCTAAASGTGKQGAANTVAHARALAGLGRIEQAVDLACRSWDVAAPLGSRRTLHQIRTLHAGLPHTSAIGPLTTRLDAAW
jgi:transcriptional regulator with XRE-family HTH domain